jgi:capping protein alpha
MVRTVPFATPQLYDCSDSQIPDDYRPHTLPESDEAFRAELAASLRTYTRNHFVDGVASVATDQVPVSVKAATEPEAEPKAEAEEAEAEEAEETAAEDAEAKGKEVAAEEAEKEEAENEVKDTDADAQDAEKAVDAVDTEDVAEGTPAFSADGLREEAPTPGEAEEAEPATADEVDAPGGLNALDDELAEVKAEAEEEAEAEAEEEEEEEEPREDEAPAHPLLDNPVFVLEVVGNRYKPSNFWTGRWRTRWTVDRGAGTVTGVINADVHYFEQGNVGIIIFWRRDMLTPLGPAHNHPRGIFPLPDI